MTSATAPAARRAPAHTAQCAVQLHQAIESANTAAARLAAARARHLQRQRALDEAAAATALPRHWPAWGAAIAALAALASHFWPWGVAPGI